MGVITLTNPTTLTVVNAGLHAVNYATLQAVLNGSIDSANFATGKIFAPSKIMQNGATTGQVLAWSGSVWAPANGMVRLFDSTLGSDTANFDITSISGAYSALKLTLYARGDTAASNTVANLRFNNDSGANYDGQSLQGVAAIASAGEGFGATSVGIAFIPANTAAANLFGGCEVWIPHYAGSANNKAFVVSSAHKIGTATTNMTVGAVAGFWRSNSAITRITILPAAGNFKAGSRCTLYGLM